MKRRILPMLLVTATLSACAATPTSSPTMGGKASSELSNRQAAPAASAESKAAIAPLAPPAPGSADMAAGAIGGFAGPGAVPPTMPIQQSTEALKAGAVDDNAKYSEFLQYLKDYQGPKMRPLDVSERYVIRVVDADGKAVSNADVTVAAGDQVLFTGKSYANGQLLFHPKAQAGAEQAVKFKLNATKGDNTGAKEFSRSQEGIWELKLARAESKPAPKLDVLFFLDATGSMGGEIAKLQSTINTISTRIKGLQQAPSVRFGLVAYRDKNDAYVTRKTDFTEDMAAFQSALNQVQAGGGGDTPEDVESALNVGLGQLSWGGNDTVRLSFLVADAAPHVDYPQSVPYTDSMVKAAALGVKLFPIGTSGLAAEGEYAFRQLAQYTMGQYLFVTSGGDEFSGGGGAASATVDKFKEGRLDDIVVDIVTAEIDSLGK